MRNSTTIIDYLKDKPEWLNGEDLFYITLMGSRAYKTNTIDSDWDFYGFVVPPEDLVFPHITGEILGFGNQIKRFDQFQAQHVNHSLYGKFDITIYN